MTSSGLDHYLKEHSQTWIILKMTESLCYKFKIEIIQQWILLRRMSWLDLEMIMLLWDHQMLVTPSLCCHPNRPLIQDFNHCLDQFQQLNYKNKDKWLNLTSTSIHLVLTRRLLQLKNVLLIQSNLMLSTTWKRDTASVRFMIVTQ
jgi:hypothetical protein